MESKGPGRIVHAQDDLNLSILRMLEETFSLGAAQVSILVFHSRH